MEWIKASSSCQHDTYAIYLWAFEKTILYSVHFVNGFIPNKSLMILSTKYSSCHSKNYSLSKCPGKCLKRFYRGNETYDKKGWGGRVAVIY